MPVTFNFDLEDDHNDDRTRINIAFERFGWESVGGSSWRYPALGKSPGPDDFFGQVLPPLRYFQDLIAAKRITVKKHSMEGQIEAYGVERECATSGNTIQIGHSIPTAQSIVIGESTLVHAGKKLSPTRFRKYLVKSQDLLA